MEVLTFGTHVFRHVPASGAEVLKELRVEFSRVWMKKFYALGRDLFEAAGYAYIPHDPEEDCDALYNRRRDAEGVPYNRAARMKTPPTEAAQASLFHHLLINAAADPEGAWYKLGGKTIRIVQGAGQALNSVRERYREPPALTPADIVVCAGAADWAVPGHIIGTPVGASIVRPKAGGGSQWMTITEARAELGI
jgi:hypothetical protein